MMRDFKGRPLNGDAPGTLARVATNDPPAGAPCRVGDRVDVLNGYGVRLEGLTVLGFVPAGKQWAGRVYINWDCWWLPVEPDRIITTA